MRPVCASCAPQTWLLAPLLASPAALAVRSLGALGLAAFAIAVLVGLCTFSTRTAAILVAALVASLRCAIELATAAPARVVLVAISIGEERDYGDQDHDSDDDGDDGAR